MLKNKTVLLGVTGGIAAYKAAYLASALVKLHANVEVVMTANATQFVAPLLFEQLTGNRCAVDTFDRNFPHKVEHVALADKTDLAIIAPATANVCAKLAHGIADDMLTTTILACRCPKLIAPAMNTKMFENPVTQDNLDILNRYGWEVIPPVLGRLACGTEGLGKLPEPDLLVQHVLRAIALPHDLEGKRVLVSAGPTREALDPVRFLSNHSTGKMGYAIAKMAAFRGAEVILVSGPTALEKPPFVGFVPVVSAGEMFEAVTKRRGWADIIVMAAPPPCLGKICLKKATMICLCPCNGLGIFWDGWGNIAGRDRFSADFPWRPVIWWKTAAKNWRKRGLTSSAPII